MKNKILISATCAMFLFPSIWEGPRGLLAQNIGINTTGATPNAKALLDIDGTTGGLLIPRMTTAQRNALAPAGTEESLLIYNTTTQCFEAWNATTSTWVAFGCIGCIVPTAVTASAAPNPICVGSTLTLTGGATNATAWQWTGPNSYSSTSQSPTIAGITAAGAGVYTLTASNTCASAAPVSTASVSVSATPTTANAGTDITPACDATTATLAGNSVTPPETGLWTVISGTATITTPSSPTSGVTGLAVPGVATLRWTISNSPCADSFDEVVITTTSCCGGTFTDNYTTTAGWTQVGACCPDISSGVVTYSGTTGNCDQRKAYKSLGLTLCDNSWTADFDFFISSSAVPSAEIFGLSDNTSNLYYTSDVACTGTSSFDYIGVTIYDNSPPPRAVRITTKDATTFGSSTYIDLPTNGITYYVRLARTSATNVTLSVFSDAARTTQIAGSPVSLAIPATIVGLQYLQHANGQGGGAGRTLTGTIDNTSIY